MKKEINNNLEDSYCSHQVSKLLRDNGFNIPSRTWYEDIEGELVFQHNYPSRHGVYIVPNFRGGECYAPTHSLALKWLAENFYIHTSITTDAITWDVKILKLDPKLEMHELISTLGDGTEYMFTNHDEAAEGALLYILKNLLSL